MGICQDIKMADHFIKHDWFQNTEVIWSDDLSHPVEFIVGGHRMSPEEFNRDFRLQAKQEILRQDSIDIHTMMSDARLLEELTLAIHILKIRIQDKHC